MSSTLSTYQKRDGDSCAWITPTQFDQIEDSIYKRDFPTDTELYAVYTDVRIALDYGGINFAVVGGYALNAYGIRRQTRDVDFYFNATDEQIFGVLRSLPSVAIKDRLVSTTGNFRVHFILSTGSYVAVDFHRVPIDLKLESNKNVLVLDDNETRTLTSTGFVNSKLRGFHHRHKAGLSTLQDEEDIYRLVATLIRAEEVVQLNRNYIVKEFLQVCSLDYDHKQVIRDIVGSGDFA